MGGVIDISVALQPGSVPIYPDDVELRVERTASISDGDPANVSALRCTAHCGTHVDAPAHFLPGGAGVDAVPLDALIGPATVIDAGGVDGHIDARVLSELELPDDARRLLFRTRNSALWNDPRFTPDFVALTEDAALSLVERGVRLVGVDYLSVAPYDDPVPTHVALLQAGVAIVECLDLRRADPGSYHLTCLPLRLVGADGAPARAVLVPAEP